MIQLHQLMKVDDCAVSSPFASNMEAGIDQDASRAKNRIGDENASEGSWGHVPGGRRSSLYVRLTVRYVLHVGRKEGHVSHQNGRSARPTDG